MKIDRSRFLVLTAALAAASSAAGCTIIDERGKDAGATPADTGATSDTGAATADTGAGSDVSSDGTTPDATRDGTSEADAGPTCDDSIGTPRPCSEITGTGCTTEIALCGRYGADLKPAVAKGAIDCMIAHSLPTCEGTTFDFRKCAFEALDLACTDATAATLCQKWKDDCAAKSTPVDPATFTVEGCQRRLNGITAAGRTALTTCFVTEGGCGTFSTIDSCIQGL